MNAVAINGPKMPVSLELGLEVLANCVWVLGTNSDLLQEHSELLCLLSSSNLVVLIHPICGMFLRAIPDKLSEKHVSSYGWTVNTVPARLISFSPSLRGEPADKMPV